MGVVWLSPLAWTGIALVLVPLIIHLLARQHSRRILFPSLRFVSATQLSALTRRRVTDWPLLVIRMLIVAAAVAAVASPVFVSSARRAAWDARVVRAVVLTEEIPAVTALADEAGRGSFISERFVEPRLADAIRSAADWFRQQPPAARELVIVGDVRERAISAADFELLGPHVGIRFVPAARDVSATSVSLGTVTDDGQGRAATFRVQVEADLTDTRATYVQDTIGAGPSIGLVASADQQSRADALLRAVLREGLVFTPDDDRQLTFIFGSRSASETPLSTPTVGWMQRVLTLNPDVRGGQAGNTLVVWTALEPADDRALEVLAGVVRSAFTPDLDSSEPRRAAAATLAAWSRPASGSPADVQPADEGDRRWFWGAALALLALEQLIRRRREHA